MTSVVIFGVLMLLAIYAMALITHAWLDSKRSRRFDEHEDEMMETITELRIRRNLNQGG